MIPAAITKTLRAALNRGPNQPTAPMSPPASPHFGSAKADVDTWATDQYAAHHERERELREATSAVARALAEQQQATKMAFARLSTRDALVRAVQELMTLKTRMDEIHALLIAISLSSAADDPAPAGPVAGKVAYAAQTRQP